MLCPPNLRVWFWTHPSHGWSSIVILTSDQSNQFEWWQGGHVLISISSKCRTKETAFFVLRHFRHYVCVCVFSLIWDLYQRCSHFSVHGCVSVCARKYTYLWKSGHVHTSCVPVCVCVLMWVYRDNEWIITSWMEPVGRVALVHHRSDKSPTHGELHLEHGTVFPILMMIKHKFLCSSKTLEGRNQFFFLVLSYRADSSCVLLKLITLTLKTVCRSIKDAL